jgi:alpha-2-macroglobulin-like protein
MFQPTDHVASYVDDFLHGLLSDADATHVRQHCGSCSVCKEALEQAEKRKQVIEAVPPEKAPEPLIQETVEKAELPAPPVMAERVEDLAKKRPVVQSFWPEPVKQPKFFPRPLFPSKRARRATYGGIIALAAGVALVLGILHWQYARLEPSPYDLSMLGQQQLLTGAPGAVRVRLTNKKTHEPVANVPVEVELLGQGQVVKLASFTTDGQGTGNPRFTLPEWQDGKYRMRVRAQTDKGEEKVEHDVELTRSWRLMLSTDKPVYQPGQTIQVRALGLRKPDLKPVAGQEAVFTITDPKGTMIFKQRSVTSRFGITAAECPLATEIIEGNYAIACTVGNSASKSTVEVKKYVLPKFRIGVTFDKPYYQPGQKVNVTVQTDYFFGKPVVGGTVKLLVAGEGMPQTLQRLEGKTDDTGKAKFDFLLPARLIGRPQDRGDARFNLQVDVTDTAEQSQSKQTSRLVTTQPLKVEIIPEAGRLVQGVDNIIYLWASYADGQPAANVRLSVSGHNQELTTNSLGMASFTILPKVPVAQVSVRATDADGRSGNKTMTLTTEGGTGFLVRPDKASYDGGSTVKLTALGSGVEPIFVDFLKDGQTLLTEVIVMSSGKGELAFDLPAELFGTLEICAYRYHRDSGLPEKQSRVIYVRQARQLQITAALDHKEYRPGSKAKLKLTLTNDKGQPTPGALSLAAVDEAVYDVLEQAPGMEKVFFLLEQQLLKPVYAIYPWAPDLINARPEERQEFDRALFSKTVTMGKRGEQEGDQETNTRLTRLTSLHSMARESFGDKVERIARERRWGLEWMESAWTNYLFIAIAMGVLLFLTWLYETYGPRAIAVFGASIFGLFIVGSFFVFVVSFRGCGGGIKNTASSTQGKAMAAEIEFAGGGGSGDRSEGRGGNRGSRHFKTKNPDRMAPAPGMGGGAGGGFDGPTGGPGAVGGGSAPEALRLGGNDGGPGQQAEEPQPLRVREWFPETLLWRPEVITNDQGVAHVDVDLADSITTWRLLASAVSAQGQLGGYQDAVRVFQPFFCDLNLPVALTRNDEVAVPVVVYNYLEKPQTVQLTLNREDWFTLLDEDVKSIALKPGEVKSVSFRLRATKVGKHSLQATALGSGVADALKKEIEVEPDGRRVERIVNGSLLQGVDMTFDLPADAIPGSGKLILKLYPSSFSQLVEGLDGIYRQPYGCFEQTSSTTYPNVLALDYLRRVQKSVPGVEAKAKQYIHLGYQRLLGFEVSSGGFDWYGRPPANVTLTAYGLMEFEDMARVHDVDPELIQRTRRWLLRQQRTDGSWASQGDYGRQLHSDLASTAYVAWAVYSNMTSGLTLGERLGGRVGGPPDPEVFVDTRIVNKEESLRTWKYLALRDPNTIDDPYTLALVCNALLAMNGGKPEEIQPYLIRLEGMKQTSPDGKQVYWGMQPGRRTQFYGAGYSANVETTALAALAFMKAKQYPAATQGALTWLISQKDANGTWHGTQGTVLALKALIAGTGANLGADKPRKIEVILNDGDRREVTIAPDQAEVMQQLDLSHLLRPGANRLILREPISTGTGFQIAYWHYVPGPAQKPKEPLAIRLDYDRTNLQVGQEITVKASVTNQMTDAAPMVMLDLPIPAGFQVQAEDFAVMVSKGQIVKFQMTPRSVIVYLLRLNPGQPLELQYRLRATMPVKLQAPGGVVYEYYDRDKRGNSPTVPLVVN